MIHIKRVFLSSCLKSVIIPGNQTQRQVGACHMQTTLPGVCLDTALTQAFSLPPKMYERQDNMLSKFFNLMLTFRFIDSSLLVLLRSCIILSFLSNELKANEKSLYLNVLVFILLICYLQIPQKIALFQRLILALVLQLQLCFLCLEQVISLLPSC